MKKGLIVVGVIVAVIAVLGLAYVGTYNNFVTLRESVTKASSDIDTVLERRADLIPNLVNTVKGYTTHEESIIDKITTARANLVSAKTVEEKAKANEELSASLSALNVIVENYPDLKSSENFINLQDELAGTENRIAVVRKDYNAAVNSYNTAISKFPGSVVAGMANFEKATYFEASEGKKDVPEVNFN